MNSIAKRKRKTSTPKTANGRNQTLVIYGQPVTRQHLRDDFRIPPQTLDTILTTANVPKRRWSAIRSSIESAIIERKASELADREQKRVTALKSPYNRIARQAERLMTSVQQLDPGHRAEITASLTKEEEEHFLEIGKFWLPYRSAEVPYEREIGLFAALARRAGVKPKKTVAHRPRFSADHRRLLALTVRLYELIVEKGGGTLTVWHDMAHDQLKGTLPIILDTLRPFLPVAIPKKLNYSTLSRFLRQAKNPQKLKAFHSTN